MLLAVVAALWRAKDAKSFDAKSFEAVCLFSLLGLTLTLAFPGLMSALN